MSYKAAIFDMDGTILDTSMDLIGAVNYAMAQHGHKHDFTREEGCFIFGSGIHTAIQRALAIESGLSAEKAMLIGADQNVAVPGIDEEEVQRILTTYRPYYKAHNAVLTCPYPGITDLIRKLKDAGILTAVVSNKPDNSVVQLAEDYFGGQFDLAIGETDGIARKPAPDMNYLALRKLGVDVKDAVYIGDTEIDIRTAANTGMDLIMVEWGFRPKAMLQSLGAKVFVSSADEIYTLITQ